ncbi:MAG TPA: GNAT family N-acetyltransferase [Thermoanaerobaculia bacterium]|nr:GNAT family N-acetyltransferase [Thermoanaerobaculia bacterium]
MTTLRPARPEDREFLLSVYASTRAEELAPVPWTDEQKGAFLRMQFDAQDAHYRAHHEGATYDVIEVDGVPAGRLTLHRRPKEIRLVDIALLPRFRGSGIGTSLVAELIAESEKRGVPLTIHVEMSNPARRLYERLGFTPVEEHGVYLLMERRPEAVEAPVS